MEFKRLQEIAMYMQSQDRNGTWEDAINEQSTPKELSEFRGELYCTLWDWMTDGLDVTPRVRAYILELGANRAK